MCAIFCSCGFRTRDLMCARQVLFPGEPHLYPAAPGGGWVCSESQGPPDPGEDTGLWSPSCRDGNGHGQSSRTRCSFTPGAPAPAAPTIVELTREGASRKPSQGEASLGRGQVVVTLGLPLALDPPGTGLFLERASLPCLWSPRPGHWDGGAQAAGVGGATTCLG